MYEQHFGLTKSPFTARAAGSDVFVGPQTATAMAGIRKGLQAQDACIVITGPAGSGKSTLVGKALDAVAGSHRSVRIGRMSLKGTDVLEFLLEELGVTELPRGTIRQFAALREKIGQLQNGGQRLVIVVEDAVLTGVDTMAELEALTAADAGESSGAAIVAMGDEGLQAFLGNRQLARLAQRVRLRHEITPLSPAELRGYLAHCFRKAGKEFESIFDANAAVVIHDLCNGNPRVANNLVDAALDAAAASGLSPVSGKFIAEVGSNQLGLVASRPVPAEPVPVPEPVAVAEPVAEPTPAPVHAVDTPAEPAAEAVDEAAVEDVSKPAEQPEPIIVFSDEPRDELLEDELLEDELLEDELIPELIQDTLPDLEVLAPEVMEARAAPELSDANEPEPAAAEEPAAETAPEAVAEPVPEAEPEPELEPIPQPAEAAPAAESEPDDVPDWERDPTMAELRPDLDALEKAMAFAHGDDDAEEPPLLEPIVEDKPEPPVAEIEEIPEITLDNAIQHSIENSLIDEPGAISAGTEAKASSTSNDLPEVRIPAKNAKKADQEIERIAAELAKAKTIEDVDDKLAETLFGEEFNLVAAQVVANGPGGASANDGELSLFDTGAATMAQAAGTPVTEGMSFDEPALEVALETGNEGGDGGLDLSASQRLKTVRSLNTDPHPSAQEAGNGHEPATRNVATPEPIEDQINTSMTQTLKALNVRPPISSHDLDDAPDDDEEEEKKGGFFSRFRRS